MKTKANANKKHMLIYIAVILVLAIIAFFLIVGNPFKYFSDKVISSNSYQDEESYGDVSSIFQDQIESYLSSYLANAEDNLGYVTEDDMTAITAEITTGILNSVPANELTEDNWNEIRQFVTDAVATAMTEYNISNAGDTSQEFVLTDEFKNYITSQVVPAITAEYQIYKNDIEDLRSSLTKISNEYSKNKASYDTLIQNIENSLKTINVDVKRVSDVASSTTEIDNLKTVTSNLETNIKNLSTALDSYKSETAQNFTDVEKEIAELTDKVNSAIARLEQLTQQQIEDVKTNLKAQIEANSNLLDSQKEEYTKKIDEIQASTSSDLMNAVGQLQNDITQKNNETTTLLQQTINNLYGGADGTVTIQELINQIQNNTDYTDEQKNQLIELINAKYGTLESSTKTNIDTVKSDLAKEVENRKQYTDDAINDLKTSLSGQLASLTKDMSSTKSDLSNTKSDLSDTKTDLSNTKNDLKDTKTTVTDHEKRLTTAETDISNINASIDSMTTDEWINSFTIKTSDWISSGNKYYYRVSNANIKMTPESDITVNYADSSIQVDSYVQQTGYFDIYVNTVPTGNVVVNYVHIQNRATN